jgi:prepilin-type N-terminal cleavage/methylation domain-containing protein
MLPLNARSKLSRNSRGFTAIEIAVTVVILGTLAAIASPSMMTWYSNTQVEDAVDRLEGALKESQREAIRRSADCTVTVPTGAAQTLATSDANCLVSGDRSFTNLTLALPPGGSVNTATFDYKGRQTTGQLTVLISSSQSASTTRCLVASQGLGVIRTGFWNNTTSTCTVSR